jgi:preprotein translocase subunit SecY
MQNFFHKLTQIFTEPAIRNRILFVLGALVVFRLLATIPQYLLWWWVG